MTAQTGVTRGRATAALATLCLPLGLLSAPTASVPAQAVESQAAEVRPAIVQLIADVKEGPEPRTGAPDPYGFTAFGDHVYFAADDGISGWELWRTDGVSAELFVDANPGPGHAGDARQTPGHGPDKLTATQDYLYFTAYDGVAGNELWRTDGVDSRMVADLNPGPDDSGPGLSSGEFAVLDGDVYFPAIQSFPDRRVHQPAPPWHEVELWRTTDSGVARHDINPVVRNDNPIGSSPQALMTFRDHVYFAADDGTHGYELWRADRLGHQLVADLEPGAKSSGAAPFAVLDDHLYVVAKVGQVFGLYRTNGGRPELLRDFTTLGPMTEFDGHLYFSADWRLWRTNGRTTELVDDTGPTPPGTRPDELPDPEYLTVLGDHLYFVAADPEHGRELWRTDGKTTELVKDINPGSANGFHESANIDPDFAELEGFLYFVANDGEHGRELWRTNGALTHLVRDLRPGIASSGPAEMTRLGRHLIFTATDDAHGREVWRVGTSGPGIEGPPGAASCTDGIDNDEDNLIDGADPDCQDGLLPAPPADVSAIRGDRRAVVGWSPGAGTAATGFVVTARPGGTQVRVGGDARAATVRGLRNGTAYVFEVAATNAKGTSAASITAQVTPAGAPKRVTKAKANYAKKKRVLTLRWQKAGANGAALTRYQVIVTRTGKATKVRTVKPSATRFVLERPSPGRYILTVRARNEVGLGPASAKVRIRVR